MATTIEKYKAAARSRAANLKAEIDKWRGKTTDLRKEIRESKKPNAAMGTGLAVSAAAVSGAVKGVNGDDEFMGVPIDAAAGVALLVGGVALPGDAGAAMISASAGPLSCYANQLAEEKVSEWWESE